MTEALWEGEVSLVLAQDGGGEKVVVVGVGKDPDWTEFVIGRGEGVDLFLNHPTVSRRHCRLVRRARSVALEDLGSRVGTFRNGERVSKPVGLRSGDAILVGEVRVTVRVEGAGEGASDESDAARRRAQALATIMPGTLPGPDETTVSQGRTVRETAAMPEVPLAGRDRLTIGRAATNDVHLDSPMLSRAHAELRRDGDAWAVADVGSTNGTFVNGVRVTAAKRLAKGDSIRVGPYVLEFDGAGLRPVPLAAGTRIEVRGVGKQVNDRESGKPIYLLKDVSLTILPREFVGLLGASGCGKSTFMDTVNGRRPATEGAVLYDGRNLYNHFDAFKRGIGYVPQELIFHEVLPLADVLRYASRLRLPDDTSEEEIERNIDRVLGIVGLVEQRGTLVRNLSGGQKKRVSIAIELLSRPTLLFLDEATSGLDLGTEAQMMRLFRELADGGVTTLCITHYVDSLEMCDMVAYFVKGRLAFYGPPQELKAHFGVNAIREVYLREAEKTPQEWEEEYRRSAAWTKYVAGRAAPEPAAEMTVVRPGQSLEDDVRPRDPKRQWKVLAKRYVECVLADRRNVAIMLGLAPFLGLLVSLVLSGKTGETPFENAKRQGQLCFIPTLTVFFLGIFGAIREVVKELPIYRHERFVNLEILPYLGSKAVALAAIGALQVLGLLLVLHALTDVHVNFFAQFVMLFATTIGAMALGLAISSAVDSADKAVMLMILVIIPQFLFANAFIELSGFGKFLGVAFILCFWCHDGVKSLLPDDLLALPVAEGSDRLFLFGHYGWFGDFAMVLLFSGIYAFLAYHFLRKKDGPHGKPYAIPWIRTGAWVVLRTRVRWLGGQAFEGLMVGVRAMVDVFRPAKPPPPPPPPPA